MVYDPPIEDIRSHSKFWVLGKQPLFILAWDATDYQWTNPFTGNNFNFLKYSIEWKIDGMCYQLHFNTRFIRLLLQNFLLSYG